MESTEASAAQRYAVSQHVRVEDVASKFSSKESIVSRYFFCRDDPQPVLFELVLCFGNLVKNRFDIILESLNHTVTIVKMDILVLKCLEDGATVRLSRGFRQTLPDSNRYVLDSTGSYLCEGLGVMSSMSAGLRCHIIAEIEYERAPIHPAGVDCSTDSSLHEDMTKLFENGRHADVTFVIDGEQVPAHKNILEARCSYFERMLQSNMIENQTNKIEVLDVRVEVFKELLRYLYSGQPPKFSSHVTMELLVAADKYGVERLTTICESLLSSNLHADNVIEALLLADKHDWSTLKANAMTFVKVHAVNLKKEESWKDLKSNPSLLLELLEFTCE